MTKPTICLNMIVKNETGVLKRCFDSVKHLIDYWVIVDTGSTDGTQSVIKDYFTTQDIPGELHEYPFVSFCHNRNHAMQLARGKSDYILIIDADDHLEFSLDFKLPDLVDPLYTIKQVESFHNNIREHQIFFIVKNDGLMEWRGAVHEYMRSLVNPPRPIKLIEGVVNRYNSEGCRSKDPLKCEKDIAVLQGEISKGVDVVRNSFYLARTYFSIEKYDLAITWFRSRSDFGGDPQEVYYSLLYIGISQLRSGEKQEVFLESFMRAHQYRPSRAEALYEIIRYYTEQNSYAMGLFFSQIAILIPPTEDNLFVETWVQEWGISLYLFLCCKGLGRTEEAELDREYLLNNPKFPKHLAEHFKVTTD